MVSENKTVAEIVKEMRRDAVAADAWCETHGEMASAASVLSRHADRIEAAHEREVAELRECLTGALAAVDDIAIKLGIFKIVKEEKDYKRWRKALEG